ncbi:hypothetical protein LCGC14_2154070 [marine sediment metagenome]|uniref:YvrJ family protein n=1 Tax=marine sediment metagenome TaxID=412755 RepID=A0A0F9G7Q0_9ZZZZ
MDEILFIFCAIIPFLIVWSHLREQTKSLRKIVNLLEKK